MTPEEQKHNIQKFNNRLTFGFVSVMIAGAVLYVKDAIKERKERKGR